MFYYFFIIFYPELFEHMTIFPESKYNYFILNQTISYLWVSLVIAMPSIQSVHLSILFLKIRPLVKSEVKLRHSHVRKNFILNIMKRKNLFWISKQKCILKRIFFIYTLFFLIDDKTIDVNLNISFWFSDFVSGKFDWNYIIEYFFNCKIF